MKTLRWIGFGIGVPGAVSTCFDVWRYLGIWHALVVTVVFLVFVMHWLGDTLAYQWDIPKGEW